MHIIKVSFTIGENLFQICLLIAALYALFLFFKDGGSLFKNNYGEIWFQELEDNKPGNKPNEEV